MDDGERDRLCRDLADRLAGIVPDPIREGTASQLIREADAILGLLSVVVPLRPFEGRLAVLVFAAIGHQLLACLPNRGPDIARALAATMGPAPFMGQKPPAEEAARD